MTNRIRIARHHAILFASRLGIRPLGRFLALCTLLMGVGCGLAGAAQYTAVWTQVSSTGSLGAPEWRGWSAMTWVGSENRIVMWGGSGGQFLNDITGLDAAANTWVTIAPKSNCPGNTSFLVPNGSDENSLVWDPVNDFLWLYNGGSGYRCASPPLVGRTAGSGTTAAAIVDPSLSSTPNFYKDWIVRDVNGAKAVVLSYTAATKTLTLSGPLNVAPGMAYDLYVDFGEGTWSYDFATGQYSKLMLRHWGYAGYLPPARRSAGFAADATKAILFGGADFDNGTYKLDFASKSYSVLIPQGLLSSPAARGQIENQLVYDSLHGRFVLFGGRCFDPGRCTPQTLLNDTWVYNANTNAWTQATGATRPSARNQAQMYFDSRNGVVVLYGGINGSGAVLNDLWTFDVATMTWTAQSTPAFNPGGIYLAQVAFAPSSGCGYIVYGVKPGPAATGLTWRLCLTPVGGNQPPTASFTTTPSTAPVGVPIALSAAASSDPGGSIVGYAWNFGNGTTGSGVTTSKSYAAAGTYVITLTVTDNGGLTGTTTRNVTITPATNQPPVANFTATPSPTTVGTPITFSGAASSDPDGTITGYAWNFGDGTTGSGVSVAKAYSSAGTYTVTLTVTDNGGLSGVRTGTVTITSSGGGGTTVWVEDALPTGAAPGGNESFTWVTSNPAPYSGTRAHRSPPAIGYHQHYFTGATATLPVGVGDRLFTYVYLDPVNPPQQVMLQFYDGSWDHRAYWGASLIPWGGSYRGPLPATGQWVRLEVPASAVNLEGRTLSGMAFSLYGGSATWDYSGKSAGGNQPPIASFTTTPSTAPVGVPIALSAAASSDPGGSIVGYAWNFGNGTTGSGVTTSKSYAAAGTYVITLTVTDNGGLTGTTTRNVTITPATNQPPVANFTATPSPTTVGTPITFSGAASSDPDGTITGYAWNFGDGTTGGGVSVAKAYSSAGTYTVTLTVTDNGGLTGVRTGTVTITSSGGGGTTVWVQDALPTGAVPGGNESFTWVTSNPAPYSGTRAHRSAPSIGYHQHYFTGATATLPVGVGDRLFTYVYLDPVNPPQQVMLQFYDGSWEHRAYWGASLIPWSGSYRGPLPATGQWVRLEVPASAVNLEGRTLSGMAFSLYGGSATWDYSGKSAGGD